MPAVAGAKWGTWHADAPVVSRFVTDLVADEVRRLRPSGARLPDSPWPDGLALNEDGLGLDSLERLSVASALNEALHLHESGVEDLLLAHHRFGDWVHLAAQGLAEFDARLTFRTSGSSGHAKPCLHDLESLQQEVDHLAGLMAGTRRILAAVPAHHIYGFLFTVLLPARLGLGPVLDVRRHTPQKLAQMLLPGDLLVSHPAHWALVARHTGPLPDGVHGVTSTAPCPDALALDLQRLGLARLTQVYGSSETAGIGTRNTAGAPFRLMPFWSRDGADPTRLLRVTPDGRVCPHALQDRLEWPTDRDFKVSGRLDDAVQVGGFNVFPSHVRQVLLEHPEVADAAVRLMAPTEGQRIKAFVVPKADADGDALRQSLDAWALTRLTAPARPKAYTFGQQLPQNTMGKAADWPLERRLPGG